MEPDDYINRIPPDVISNILDCLEHKRLWGLIYFSEKSDV